MEGSGASSNRAFWSMSGLVFVFAGSCGDAAKLERKLCAVRTQQFIDRFLQQWFCAGLHVRY